MEIVKSTVLSLKQTYCGCRVLLISDGSPFTHSNFFYYYIIIAIISDYSFCAIH